MPRVPSSLGLALVLLVLTVTVFVVRKPAKILWLPKSAFGNSQDFFISASASTGAFSYNFRYDPRAADEWLFHSGPGLFGPLAPATSAQTSAPVVRPIVPLVAPDASR